MDHRHFEQFARRERRQDRRQALGEHRFSRAGRAAHQEVVAARRRHFERALGALLALDVAEVRLRPGRRAQRRLGAGQNLRALEVVGELDQRARRENLEVGRRPRRLGAARRRANQAFAGGVGGDRRRQHAGDGADRAVERQFSDHRETVERVGRNGADRRHDRERDRQVVVAALLRHVGGREVDGDALGGQGEARGDQRRAHPLARFGHRLVAEADDGEGDRAAGDMHLDVDRPGLDALERHRRYARHHVRPPVPFTCSKLVLFVDWPDGPACRERPFAPCAVSTWGGRVPRWVGRDASPVGSCARSASTGIDRHRGGPSTFGR